MTTTERKVTKSYMNGKTY